jgi:TolB protein
MVPAPRGRVTTSLRPSTRTGSGLFFSINSGDRSGIYSYNVVQDCCFTNLVEGRSEDISPSFAPDGQRLVFNSNRLGVGAPQIYSMSLDDGGRPEVFSPYAYDRPGYYTSPDWSPMGDRVAYQGRVEQRGAHQILVAELDERGRVLRLNRITFDGVNEDPSWAPDGRHLVYVAARSTGYATLHVTDVVTGNTRTLVSGIRPNLPAWSPTLRP